MKIPMREKYVDEAAGVWFIFGECEDGTVDISDGEGDVLTGLPSDVALSVCDAQREFRDRLYQLLCS